MNKKAVFLQICSCLLIVFSFLYNSYTILRILTLILGIIFFLVGMHLKKKRRLYIYLLIFILLIGVSFGIDYLLCKYAKRIPIFSYEVKSSKTVSTYNSFFYRVYNCNSQYIFDQFYQQNYMCDEEVSKENINSLLAHITNNFHHYHNKFIQIEGKISEITGSSSISMRTYEIPENSINGQVIFSNNLTLTIIHNGSLPKVEELKIYDPIDVIGRIDKIKHEGQNTEIIIKDATIVNRNNYQTFEMNKVESKKCDDNLKLLSKTDEYSYYSYCLDSIYVNYDQDNTYELNYVLTDKRMTYDLLTKNKEKKDTEFYDVYQDDKFLIAKCKDTNQVIISNLAFNTKKNYCEPVVVEKETITLAS